MHARPSSFVVLTLPAIFSLGACAPLAPDEPGAGAVESAVEVAPETVLRDVAGEAVTRVRAGGLSVWVDAAVRERRVADEPWLTVRLRTSRSLEGAMSWVPDDGFGDARVVSPRVVEVDLRGGHEVNSILSGLPLFVHLRTAAGAAREYDVRLDLAPRLARASGYASLAIAAPLAPVRVARGGDDLVYRGSVSVAGATSLSVRLPGGGPVAAREAESGAFTFDWGYATFASALGDPAARVSFEAALPTGLRAATAGLDVAVTQVGLTLAGADAGWPPPACDASVRSCIVAEGGVETPDLAACGSYRAVSRCVDALTCEPSAAGRRARGLDRAKAAYNAACPSAGGSWCSAGEVAAFDVGGCNDAPTLEGVTRAVAAVAPPETDFGAGATLTRAELAARPVFAKHGGPRLLAAIDAYIGTTTLLAKELVADVSCQNCTEKTLRYVLFYTDTQVVVVVDARSGWDS